MEIFELVGRIIFELFSEACPRTCDNFRALCTGERGCSTLSGKPLHYKDAPFHRIVKNFMIQGGDFTNGDGTGGESIYGRTFIDESFEFKHDREFLLSMANRGKDTNGSQFFITTKPAPHLDGIHVVFGQVIQGQDIARQIENLKTDANSSPFNNVAIANCGELVLQLKSRAKKRKSEKKFESDECTDESEKHQKRKKKKMKKLKKGKKGHSIRTKSNDDEEHTQMTSDKIEIRADEIPDVPKQNFLYRGSPAKMELTKVKRSNRRRSPTYHSRNFVSQSGRKVKGRGNMRFHTPTRSVSRERSMTPPHWKQELQKVHPLSEEQPIMKDRWIKGDKLNVHKEKSRKMRENRHKEYRRRQRSSPQSWRKRSMRKRSSSSSSSSSGQFRSSDCRSRRSQTSGSESCRSGREQKERKLQGEHIQSHSGGKEVSGLVDVINAIHKPQMTAVLPCLPHF
ncbi:peptidyl-prolyl cis-trans isomerase G-like isoform X2 [Tubulanus polymorphus]|uniref:peptidyl-prolyl cis-trans isomerase G-like isoform X2 n=1 Tax=Tubulanus polymorphus TaxID=672921 RepID=UPI003DA493DD